MDVARQVDHAVIFARRTSVPVLLPPLPPSFFRCRDLYIARQDFTSLTRKFIAALALPTIRTGALEYLIGPRYFVENTRERERC